MRNYLNWLICYEFSIMIIPYPFTMLCVCVGYAFEAVKVSNFQENFVRNVLIALAMRP